MPEEAYGMPDPNAVFTVEIAQLPGSEELEAGQQVYLSNQYGQPFPVKVVTKDETTITFDAKPRDGGKRAEFPDRAGRSKIKTLDRVLKCCSLAQAGLTDKKL